MYDQAFQVLECVVNCVDIGPTCRTFVSAGPVPHDFSDQLYVTVNNTFSTTAAAFPNTAASDSRSRCNLLKAAQFTITHVSCKSVNDNFGNPPDSLTESTEAETFYGLASDICSAIEQCFDDSKSYWFNNQVFTQQANTFISTTTFSLIVPVNCLICP